MGLLGTLLKRATNKNSPDDNTVTDPVSDPSTGIDVPNPRGIDTSSLGDAPVPTPPPSPFAMSPRLKTLQGQQDYLNTHQNSHLGDNGEIVDESTGRAQGFGKGFTRNLMRGGIAGGLLGGIQGLTNPDMFAKQDNAQSRADVNNQIGIELKRRQQGIEDTKEQSELKTAQVNRDYTTGLKTQAAQAAIDAKAEKMKEDKFDKLTGPPTTNPDGTRTYLFRKADGSFYERTMGKGGKQQPDSMPLGTSKPGPNGGTYVGMGNGRPVHYQPGLNQEQINKNEAERKQNNDQYNATIAQLEDTKDEKGNVISRGAKSGLQDTNDAIANLNAQMAANEAKKPGEDDDPKVFAKAQATERTRLNGLMKTAQANKKEQEKRVSDLTNKANEFKSKRDAVPSAPAQPQSRSYSIKTLMNANPGMDAASAIRYLRGKYGQDAQITQ